MEILDSLGAVPTAFNSNAYINYLDIGARMDSNNVNEANAIPEDTVNMASGEMTAVTQTFTERNLELKLPILSSSSSDSESQEPINPTAGTSATTDRDRTASPPPNCAICLGRCKNKCFTDSCMHQFCFKCLCEWSKVKPECPLCKQTFKSIIHNVKSIHQFEEYHVQPPTVQLAHPPFEMDFQEMRIFGVVHQAHNRSTVWNGGPHRQFFYGDFSNSSRYEAASTAPLSSASGSSTNRSIPSSANSSGSRNQYVYRGELLDMYRQEYPGAIANSVTLSQLWRRYVYDRKLYAMPVADVTGRFRDSSARFYRDNPSQIHRLMPWINRDIVCLLRHSQQDVGTVLESINSALTLMNILSPAFRRRLQPILGTKTAHFIHELNNFARSPYDMIGYDRAVQYVPQTNNQEIVIEFTSSDESNDTEQISVAGDGGNNSTASMSTRSRSTNASSINAINLTIHNRLTSASGSAEGSRVGSVIGAINEANSSEVVDDVNLVIDLRGESDNNDTLFTAQATPHLSNYHGNQTSGVDENGMDTSITQPIVSENIELTSGSSDECEFVLERKPPHLRTPEMVSLDSASDSDVVFVDETKPLNRTSFSSSEEEINQGPRDHKHHTRHHNKIAALVEAKKRNQSANVVKSEQQDSHTDVYNLGASTSAALRLSLQKRLDKSLRSGGVVSSKMTRRDKYSLRNSNSQSRPDRQVPKRRGKRLDSESSHSSTSSSTTNSSYSSTTTSTDSSACSSGEDFVASTSQQRKGTRKHGRKIRKTKKHKPNKRSSRKTAKRASSKRNKNDDNDDDDAENSHMGKNFALVMAINERRQRQKQNNIKKAEAAENESDAENSWRSEAINEPLRLKQQQHAKNSYNSNERKRKHHPNGNRNREKLQKYESQPEQESETRNPKKSPNSEDSSSDESDNINLIQLKTKLAEHDCHKESRIEQSSKNRPTGVTTNLKSDVNSAATSSSTPTSTGIVTITRVTTTDYTTIPTAVTADVAEAITITPPSNDAPDATALTTTNETTNNAIESMTTQNLFNFSDDSNDAMQNDNHPKSTCNYQSQNQQLLSLSLGNNENNSSNQSPHRERGDNSSHNDDDAGDNVLCDDDDETCNNVPTNLNLNESNAYPDGTSMSTTTTDTILNEAAEQISSAAVNFYNPQPIFNTADFADENSTNSSSSDISVSSSTTSLSSSSNSSSSNSNSCSNYNQS